MDITRNNLEEKASALYKEAENLYIRKKFDEALEKYEEAYYLYEEMGIDHQLKKIIWRMNQIRDEVMRLEHEINAIKNGLDTNASGDLSVAEKIQLRIKKEKEERRIEGELLKTQKMDDFEDNKAKISENIEDSKENVNTEYLAEKPEEVKKKEEEMKRKIGDKKKNDMMVLKAEKLMEEGRKALEEKEFDTAKELYGQAKNIFEKINFVKQVKFLTKEIDDIDAWKKEHEINVERERLRNEIREQEFRERLEKDLDRKIGEMNQ